MTGEIPGSRGHRARAIEPAPSFVSIQMDHSSSPKNCRQARAQAEALRAHDLPMAWRLNLLTPGGVGPLSWERQALPR